MSALSQKWVREDGHSRFWFGCYVINWRGFGFNLVLLDGIRHIFSELGGFLFFALLLLLSGAVVSWKITVLAKSLRVVELLTVLAGPCFFCAAAAVVAVDAHILGIMFSALVGTGDHLPWLALLAIRAHIRYGLNVHLIFMINVIPRLKIFNTLMTSSFFNLMLEIVSNFMASVVLSNLLICWWSLLKLLRWLIVQLYKLQERRELLVEQGLQNLLLLSFYVRIEIALEYLTSLHDMLLDCGLNCVNIHLG